MRNHRFDNIKFILIVLVVLGHFLELPKDSATADSLYRVIYLFHIPTFIFVSGYFAKFNPGKILRSFIYPYVILQIAYLLFHNLIIIEEREFALQFTKPYWLLWYLMAITFYYLLIPFFQTQDTRRQIIILCASVIVSLLTGYDNSIGYNLTLSRFFVFLPYFLAGQYSHTNREQIKDKWKSSQQLLIFTDIAAIIGAICSVLFILNSTLSSRVLYGSYSYEALGYGPFIRLLLLLFAASWIIVLFRFVPNKKIPLLSSIGKHTFWIYVLHGFVIKLIGKYLF